jgi:hypothetical protein
VLIVYLGFLYWHKGQVGLDYRVLNTSLKMPTTPRSVTNWKLRSIEVGGPFKNVTRLVEACDGHLYILEKRGRIYRLPMTLGSGDPIRFLKLKNVSSAGEGGLLGLALHPDFGNNDDPNGRYAYVYYSAERDDGTRSNRLSRLTATASLDELDPKSELILIDQDDDHDWHDGGGLTFGPDGFLYLTMGDEGLSSDALGNSQEIKKDLFSGVLRIDVDTQGGEISHWPPRQPETQRDGHQLRTWNGIDLLTRSREKVKTIRPSLFFDFDALVDPYDASEDLNDRMMSYVDSNCAHCHRPYMMRTALDLRWGVDELQRHLYETEAVNPMNGTRTLLVNPANPDASELLNRVASEASGSRMPPLSTSVPDQKAIKLIRQWISSRAATASQ